MVHQPGTTFDEALIKTIGQFGPGQWKILSVASLCLVANAAAFFFWVFATVNPIATHDWECTDSSDATCQEVKQLATPSNNEFCSLPANSTRWTTERSLVASYNLVCGDAWKVQFTNSLMFMGALVGSGVFGVACDKWGRRTPLLAASAVVAVAMYASLAAPPFWVLAVLRAVTGFGAAGQSHCNFLLSTEPVGPEYRGLAGICALAFFILGEFLMVALGYALPAWQHLLLACASLNAASMLLYPLVPESGRWLLSKGRTEEAKSFLESLAKSNHSQPPSGPLVSSHSSKHSSAGFEAAQGQHGILLSRTDNSVSSTVSSTIGDHSPIGLMQLLYQRRIAVRLLVLLITSFTLMLNYYGISLGAGGIQGSIYMTFAIAAAAEAFAIIVVAPSVDRFGRHNIVSLGQLLGGSACLACAMVQGGIPQAALAAVGKFGCSAALSVSNIYIAELLPTSCRSSVMGICSQASRVGSITAPFLLMLGTQLQVNGHSQVFIPFMAFGGLAVISGLLVLTMPETLGAPMPESMQDLENLFSVFTAKPWRSGCCGLVAFMFRTRAHGLPSTHAITQISGSSGTLGNQISIGSSVPDAETHVAIIVQDPKLDAHVIAADISHHHGGN